MLQHHRAGVGPQDARLLTSPNQREPSFSPQQLVEEQADAGIISRARSPTLGPAHSWSSPCCPKSRSRQERHSLERHGPELRVFVSYSTERIRTPTSSR